MAVRTFILLFLLSSLLHAETYEKRKKRYVGSMDQKTIIYSGRKMPEASEEPLQKSLHHYYVGISAQYAQGYQRESTRLSSNFYRQVDEGIIYNELTFCFGVGNIGEDRFEIGLTMNKNFVLKDSTVEAEFEKGRSLDISYSFIFESLYNRVDPNNIIPYFRIGVAFGQFDIKDEYREYYAGDNILSTDYRAGIGLFSQLSEQFEALLRYDITKREFQDITEGSYTKKTAHNTQGISLGLNFHF